MLLRSIFSRIHKSQFLNNFSSLANVNSLALDSETAISPSKLKPLSAEEKAREKVNVISYLINTCGLSPNKAISTSKKVHFDIPEKPDAVLNFLAEHGFSKSQIAELVGKRPSLLLSDPEKTLLPKIEFFLQSTGIGKADLFRTIAKCPTFLTRSLENQLIPIYNYLNDIIGAEKVATLLRRGSWIFGQTFANRVIPNVDFLRGLGVPKSFIAFVLYHYPEAIGQKHDQFIEIVAEVKEMGFDPLKSTFVLAIHARSGEGNKALWARCYENYRKWGWSKDDIYMAFKKHPNCMLLSEKKISGVLSFLVTKMGFESRMMAQYPQLIFYSLEKRIIPRCSVVHLLSLKGLVRKDKSLSTILCLTDKYFLDKFVTKYSEEVPQLFDIYKGKAVVPEV
ncbi:Mitochondrial transcription termination factor family protein [Forsythia ovata]|uniref:Mitochondrial transcription termination factor family protein n=1 Tax=Forsythia ovata TaxID=205694 RepID=A0ABD1VGJ6_9LAMI